MGVRRPYGEMSKADPVAERAKRRGLGREPFQPGPSFDVELRRSLRERLLDGGSTPDGFRLERDPSAVEDTEALLDIGRFRIAGPIWTLESDSAQTHRLSAALVGIADIAAAIAAAVPIAAPVAGAIAAHLGMAAGHIEMVNQIGGNNGVHITGVVGAAGLMIVPRGLALPYSVLTEAARLAVAGRTILEWMIAATSFAPALGQTLSMTGLATLFNAISAGTPLGWALSLAAGIGIEEVFGSEPDPNAHGHVHADRTAVGPWETFLMSHDGNTTTLLSHMGHLCADNGGGGAVYANRPLVGEWERWTMIQHPDHTVSFRSSNGHHLVANGGGGSFCLADRSAIGPWERFHREYQPNGKVALRASGGHYLSVQP